MKYVGICILSYEEFYKFFVTVRLDDLDIYSKIREYLPLEVKEYFDILIKLKRRFSSILLPSILFRGPNFMGDGSILPYFHKNNYYKLQCMLRNRSLPKFYSVDFHELSKIMDASYDLAFFSNIYMYIPDSIKEFEDALQTFDIPVIQANYIWGNAKVDALPFIENGFIPHYIPSVTKKGEDLVLTYKKNM